MLFTPATTTIMDIGGVSSSAFSGVASFIFLIIGLVLSFWIIEIIIVKGFGKKLDTEATE